MHRFVIVLLIYHHHRPIDLIPFGMYLSLSVLELPSEVLDTYTNDYNSSKKC
jgi:hypothetical protein